MPPPQLVPDDFAVPAGLRTEAFTLEPLSVRHNERAGRAELDKPLYELVSGWLAEIWPFTNPEYAPR